MDENMNTIPQNPDNAGEQNDQNQNKGEQPAKEGFFKKAHDRWISFKGTGTGKVICFVGRRVRDGAAIYGAYKFLKGIGDNKQPEMVLIAPAEDQQEEVAPVEEPAAEQANEVVNE